MVPELFLVVTLISILVPFTTSLHCLECSDSFKTVWTPQVCQANTTAVPSRICNDEQKYCFVERETVKGIVVKITRDCAIDCYYGCKVTSFGITRTTCTQCCDTDNCNTGNDALPVTKISSFWSSFRFFVMGVFSSWPFHNKYFH